MATVYTATTNISHPQWIFPNALNTVFITEFDYQLPKSSDTQILPNGTVVPLPPSIFGKDGSRPDIIFNSVYDLAWESRIDYTETGSDRFDFGREDIVVHTGDEIALDWKGGDERVVGMACHICQEYFGGGGGVFEACDRFAKETAFVSGTLSTNTTEMHAQFHYSYSYSETEDPRRKIAPDTHITMPSLSDEANAAICIFILDWDRRAFNYKHSAPFPVLTTNRTAGVDNHGDDIYDPWLFSSEHPEGVSLNRTWSEPRQEISGRRRENEGEVIGSMVGAISGAIVLAVLAWLCCGTGPALKKKHGDVEVATEENELSVVSSKGVESTGGGKGHVIR